MEKKRNLWVIPTDKPSRLGQVHEKLSFFKDRTWDNTENWRCKNIYITSDEEIKEREVCWVLNKTNNNIFLNNPENGKIAPPKINVLNREYNAEHFKKIILTTDTELIKNGVQAIDDEFLQWFVKNQSCEEVEVVDEGYQKRIESEKAYQERLKQNRYQQYLKLKEEFEKQ